MKLPKNLKYILLLAFVARVLFMAIFVDLKSENYWEYGDIAQNLINGKGYSFWYFENDAFHSQFKEDANPLPSAHMPPGYVFFLVPFMLIKNVILRNISILLIQIILSLITIVLLFRLTERYFNHRTAFFAALILAILPEFIFASNSIGPTIIYHLGIILIFLILYSEKLNTKTSQIIGIISAGIFFLRPEILLFIFLISIVFILQKHFKQTLIILTTTFILILPWQIRNYYSIGSFTTITTSSGLNFYRGHNPYRPGVWGDEKIEDYTKKYKNEPNYELKMSNFLSELGLKNIRENPKEEIKNTFVKIFQFWIINPDDKRTGNIFYLVPWLIILTLSIIGLYKSCSWKKYKYVYLFILYHTIIAILFFALPRYQTMMKIALIPFAAYGIDLLYSSLFIKNKH
jgi:hypothetical protein